MSETANAASLDAMIVRSAEAAVDQIGRAREAIATVVFGQSQVVENALITILSGGHGLVVGVPGLAKTKLVDTMGTVLGLNVTSASFGWLGAAALGGWMMAQFGFWGFAPLAASMALAGAALAVTGRPRGAGG